MVKRPPSPTPAPSASSNKIQKLTTTNMASPNTSGAIARITKEIAHIQTGTDLSLGVACSDSDVRNVRALIIGPPETPYEYGFFEFEVKFGKEYPIKSPHVRCITTNGGRCRFNPNIYAEGKVCLSILGTWRGQPGEEWSSAQGLESVLLSIQSLMSANPYENEPGYETHKKDEAHPKAYIAKIRHESLRISVITRLETVLGLTGYVYAAAEQGKENKEPSPYLITGAVTADDESTNGTSTPATTPSVHEYDAEATFNLLEQGHWDPFADLMKRRFLWYYDTYLQTIDKHMQVQKDGSKFGRMQFEYPPNSMDGVFDYKALRTRLQRIKQALEDERQGWAKAGAKQAADGTQLATQLAFQFKQLQHQWNHTQYESSRMELGLDDPSNPFVWHLTLFGKPMTNLDGGIFNLTLAIPPTFPNAQPYVNVDTPIFHYRVSSAGTLCYFPKKEDEIASHLEAIVEAIENDNPTFDPRAVVNPEAFGVYWGGEDKRKIYNRKLRRSAQESCEY